MHFSTKPVAVEFNSSTDMVPPLRCERFRAWVPSTMLLWKLSKLEIPLDKELIANCLKQPVYTQHTLSHSIFYLLFSGWWWSGSPTNTMFLLDVKKWVMVKKVGKESTLFCLHSLKVIEPWIFHMLNNAITDLHKQSLVFLLRGYARQIPPQEMVVSGCSVAMWHSVNLLPSCDSTGHANWKNPKTHGNH